MYDDRSIGLVGTQTATDGQFIVQRMSRDACQVTQAGHAHYQEAALRGNVFIAANQANTALTAAGVGTGIITGFSLYNPIASGKNAVIWNTAPCIIGTGIGAQLSAIGLITGTYTGVAAPTGTTTLPIKNAIVAPATTNVCVAYSTATYVGTPAFLTFLQQYEINTSTNNTLVTTPIIDTLDGAVIIPPGQFVGIANTVSGGLQVMMISMAWEEIPTS